MPIIVILRYSNIICPWIKFSLLVIHRRCIAIKDTVSPYTGKYIFSNGSRMGISNYTWASGVLMSQSRHLPMPSWLLDLYARDLACTMVLASEKAQKGPLTAL